jgi:hypothetical protein
MEQRQRCGQGAHGPKHRPIGPQKKMPQIGAP